jgi:O-antigen/teichoic acid export membrane protein
VNRQPRFTGIAGSLRRQLVHGSVASIGMKMASLGLNLAVTVVLARLLAPAGYGAYALVLAIVSLLAVPIQLGLPTLVLREVTVCVAAGDWNLMRTLLRWAQRIILTMSAAIGTAAVIIVWQSGGGGSEFLPTLLIAVPLLAIGALTAVRQSVLMGLKRVVLAQVPELLLLPVVYLTCLAAYWRFMPHPLPPQWAMAAYVACYGAAFILGAVLLARTLPSGYRSARASAPPKAWARSILPLSLISGFSVISSQLVLPILGFFAGDASVGLYRVAASGAALTTVVGATIGSLVSPYIATLYGRREFGKLQILARYSAWACLIPALIALVLFSAAGDVLLRYAFGDQFRAAAGALVVLTIGQTINCATGIVHSLLTMTGHERDTLRGAILGTGVNVVLALLLAPRFGLMGVAIATCVAVAAENVLLYATVQARLHIGSSVFSFG